jgi:2-C-methyl-D-erythritol 4-phosphate cytidylyltransferase
MKKWAIIVAGGSGQRMGSPIPKQFLLLNDRPLLYYTIDAFYAAYSDMQVVLVLPADHLTLGQSLIDSAFADKNIILTTGGATRFDSVKNGLALTPTDAVIFVHDGVRCLVSPQLVRRCYEGALQSGAVVPAIGAGGAHGYDRSRRGDQHKNYPPHRSAYCRALFTREKLSSAAAKPIG